MQFGRALVERLLFHIRHANPATAPSTLTRLTSVMVSTVLPWLLPLPQN
jgi:hypothetical protein